MRFIPSLFWIYCLTFLCFAPINDSLSDFPKQKNYLKEIYKYYHSSIPFVDYVKFFQTLPEWFTPTEDELKYYAGSRHQLTPGVGNYDPYGIPFHPYTLNFNTEARYNPLFIANNAENFVFSIFNALKSDKRPDPRAVLSLIHLSEWLRRDVFIDPKTGIAKVAYTFTIHTQKRAPWFSAMTQLRIAKLFIFNYFLFRKNEDLDLAISLVKSFRVNIKNNEFVYKELVDGKNLTFYEEYHHPLPSHSYNGHQSIGSDAMVLRDLMYALSEQNPKLKKDPKVIELVNELNRIINESILTIEVASKYFFNPESLEFALYKEPGSKLINLEANIANTEPSYDLVHIEHFIKSLEHGYVSVRPILARYLAYLILRDNMDAKRFEALSYIDNSISKNINIDDRSNFDTILKNRDASCRDYLISEDNKGNASFELKVSGPIQGVELQFYPDQWPQVIELKGYSSKGTEILSIKEDFSPVVSDLPRKKFDFQDLDLDKLKFNFDNYYGKPRLVLCYIKAMKPMSDLISTPLLIKTLNNLFGEGKVKSLDLPLTNEEGEIIERLTSIIDDLLNENFQNFKNTIYEALQFHKIHATSPIISLINNNTPKGLTYPEPEIKPISREHFDKGKIK